MQNQPAKTFACAQNGMINGEVLYAIWLQSNVVRYPRPVVIPNILLSTFLSAKYCIRIQRKSFASMGTENTWSCPSYKSKRAEARECISREPIPEKASNEDIYEESISGDIPPIGYRICTPVQYFKQSSISQSGRPNLEAR